MSVANLNTNGTLRCGKLVLAGTTIVPADIGGTTLQVGSGTPQSGAITLAGSVVQSGATFTFSGSGGGTTVPTLWSDSSAYAIGDVVSVDNLNNPSGTFICIESVAAGTGNPAPKDTPTKWTPVAPLAGASSGVSSLIGGGTTPVEAVGSVLFSADVTSGASTALTWTSSADKMVLGGTISSGGGITAIKDAGSGETTSLTPAFSVGTITNTTAGNSLTFTATADGVALAGNISSAGGGVASIAGGTAPATGAVKLQGGDNITLSGGGGADGTIIITATGGSQTVPYIVAAGQKAWTANGTTDSITVSALPAGTYIIMLSWGMATAPPGVLTCPPPTAGATTVAVVASSTVAATSVYQYSIIRLTT